MHEQRPIDADTTVRSLSGWKAALLIVLGLIAVTLVAAAMPARIKLLGLFPIAFAALIGYVFGRIAVLAGMQRRGVLVPLTTVVVLAGLAGYYGESYRRWRSDREQYYSDHLGRQPGGQQMLQHLQGNMLSADPLVRQFEEQYRTLMQPTFVEYLDQRVASARMGDRELQFGHAWALAVFIGESLIGLVAGVVASIASSRRPPLPVAGKATA